MSPRNWSPTRSVGSMLADGVENIRHGNSGLMRPMSSLATAPHNHTAITAPAITNQRGAAPGTPGEARGIDRTEQINRERDSRYGADISRDCGKAWRNESRRSYRDGLACDQGAEQQNAAPRPPS